MEKISKKNLRSTIEVSLNRMFLQLKVASPSKKSRRVIEKAAKELANVLKDDLKKQIKMELLKKLKPAAEKKPV
jgi:hypothetical protein